MNLFVIISILILFHGKYISGVDTEELDGIDVLKTLKSEVSKCDLRDFVKTDDDHQALQDDLNKYCTPSDSTKQYRIVCHMIYYELKKACELPDKSRPSKFSYSVKTTADEICKMKKIQLTNQWILKKITNNGQKQIGVDDKDLCTKITSDSNVLVLIRFFYKFAPRVRQADLSKQNKDDTQSNTGNKTLAESVVGAVKSVKDAFVNGAETAKEKAKEVLGNAKNRTNHLADKLKNKVDQTVDDAKDKADEVSDAAKDARDKVVKTGEEAKDKVEQGVESTKTKAGQVLQGVKDKAGEVSAAVKDGKDKVVKTAEEAKDKLEQGVEKVKTKASQTLRGVKDKAEEVRNAAEDAKDKVKEGVDSAKTKAGQAVDDTKDKAEEVDDAAEDAKDKVVKTAEDAKDKVKQGVDNVKTNAEQAVEDAKDKAGEVGDATKDAKDKVGQGIENAKNNVTASQNVSSNIVEKTGDVIQVGIDKAKQIGQSIVNKTSEGLKSLKNATGTIVKDIGEKGQQILDIKKGKKDQDDEDDGNDADDDNDKKTNDKEEDKQIAKPNISDKKDGQKDRTPTESVSNRTKTAEPSAVNKTPDVTIQKTEKSDQNKNDASDDNESISKVDYDADHPPRPYTESENPSDNNEDAEYQGDNKKPSGSRVDQQTDDDKSTEKNVKPPNPEPPRAVSKPKTTRKYADDDGWSGNFVTYFLVFTLVVVVGYLALHNKNKVLGLLIEGCRRDRSSHGRRSGGSSARYQRLSQSS